MYIPHLRFCNKKDCKQGIDIKKGSNLGVLFTIMVLILYFEYRHTKYHLQSHCLQSLPP